MEQAKTAKREAAVAHPTRDQGLNGLKGKQVVLMLQGGGALGAYQVGAFEALANECANVNHKIEWVAGISIGAINAAVIAAPKSGDAVLELERLWDEIRSQFSFSDLMSAWAPWLGQAWLAALEPKYMDWTWLAFNPRGQANFFSSRVLDPFRNPWVQQWFRKLDRNDLGFYGTERLTRTLNERVNWEDLNAPDNTRLSLGATRVCDGEVEFFNSWQMPLNADHVRASAALTPAFPPIQIGNEWYLDGGVPNNTPIEGLARELHKLEKDTLIFLIDIWDRKNDVLPESFDDLLWRQKCIQYGSRKTAAETAVMRYNHLAEKGKLKHPVHLQLCQLMLEHNDEEPQFCFGDADFSRRTFDQLRAQGFRDMTNAFDQAEPVIDEEKGLSRGRYASLYRFGSRGKWKASRTAHRHVASNRRDLPPAFESRKEWWKQSA